MQLPPGPAFLLARLPRALAPLVVTYVLARLGAHFTAPQTPWIPRPGMGRILLLILALPLYATVNILNAERRKRKEAEALGAVPPPVVQGKFPGNIDSLLAMGRRAKEAYIGALIDVVDGGWEKIINVYVRS